MAASAEFELRRCKTATLMTAAIKQERDTDADAAPAALVAAANSVPFMWLRHHVEGEKMRQFRFILRSLAIFSTRSDFNITLSFHSVKILKGY